MCCLLRLVRGWLFVVAGCLLIVVCCLLFVVVWCSLLGVPRLCICCSVFVVDCHSAFVGCCMLCVLFVVCGSSLGVIALFVLL